jgi:cytochrome c
MTKSLFSKSILFSAGAACLIAIGSTAAFAEGDVTAGKKVYKKCKVCHSFEAGKNGQGPSLQGIMGRTAGTAEGFKFSDAMKASGIVWSDETINAYVENPKTYIPKNKMAFPGIKSKKSHSDAKKAKKAKQRLDLIAYIKEMSK